jgi:hypothetical protein
MCQKDVFVRRHKPYMEHAGSLVTINAKKKNVLKLDKK